MNEPISPTSSNRAAATGSCCAPARPAAEVAPAQSSPCCGTSEGAEAARACCDPQAKREAVANGAGCC
ncbi:MULTISPECIES: hypothetical protein [Streptomyces]|uniref:Uncharacterized protein n=1 Tax=Streptomyces spororaveus TaxID=284039 RepID=A0ABQ3T5Q4_9ACTN|nr:MULTISPECIES: hypothetical protein [Streptomyces]MCM9083560.1 hypothetical protein [Streptomyces spororaveus]MCX5301855.1 hypothetical protein [Streptomyces sp. NBC_00160]GHI75712.1 hypothetical protein Sspor_12730 [Streptomyces spororaveus]